MKKILSTYNILLHTCILQAIAIMEKPGEAVSVDLYCPEAYSKSCQTTKMKFFAKIISLFHLHILE